jgi:hypothetical protein
MDYRTETSNTLNSYIWATRTSSLNVVRSIRRLAGEQPYGIELDKE